MPYLIGPNSAAITPNRNKVVNITGTEWNAKPITERAATPISATLSRCATIDLSRRSASWPPRPDRKKYGAMKTAAASVIKASALSPPIWNRIRKTSAFFRKLSLKAEKNWHQNRGAKRRVVISEVNMVNSSLEVIEPVLTWLRAALRRPSIPVATIADCASRGPAGGGPMTVALVTVALATVALATVALVTSLSRRPWAMFQTR